MSKHQIGVWSDVAGRSFTMNNGREANRLQSNRKIRHGYLCAVFRRTNSLSRKTFTRHHVRSLKFQSHSTHNEFFHVRTTGNTGCTYNKCTRFSIYNEVHTYHLFSVHNSTLTLIVFQTFPDSSNARIVIIYVNLREQ